MPKPHSIVMPTSLMTLDHVAISFLMNAPNSSGELPTGSGAQPHDALLDFGYRERLDDGLIETRDDRGGVPAGTITPFHSMAS